MSVEALEEQRPPAQTAAQARRTLAFALAAGLSAAEGREVTLSELEDSQAAGGAGSKAGGE